MRWLLLLGLVSCYRPAAERCVECPEGVCPAGLACIDGVCGGAASCSAPDDGTVIGGERIVPLPACELGTLGPGTSVFQSPEPDVIPTYTASLTGTATFKFAGNSIGIAPLESIQFAAVIGDGERENRAPVISPEGDQIFVHTQVPGGGAPYALAVSYRNASSWSVPQPLSIIDLTMTLPIGNSDLPGTPTASGAGARRMVVETAGGFTEIEEITRESWRRVASYTPSTLGALGKISHPQLSYDGKRLVYLADGGTLPEIKLAARVDLVEPFTPTTTLVTGTALSHPFLTADCTRLYYFSSADSSVYRAESTTN